MGIGGEVKFEVASVLAMVLALGVGMALGLVLEDLRAARALKVDGLGLGNGDALDRDGLEGIDLVGVELGRNQECVDGSREAGYGKKRSQQHDGSVLLLATATVVRWCVEWNGAMLGGWMTDLVSQCC